MGWCWWKILCKIILKYVGIMESSVFWPLLSCLQGLQSLSTIVFLELQQVYKYRLLASCTRLTIYAHVISNPISAHSCIDKHGTMQLFHFGDCFLICEKNYGQFKGMSLICISSFCASAFNKTSLLSEGSERTLFKEDISHLLKYLVY